MASRSPSGDTFKQLDGMQPKRQTAVTPPTKTWLREERKRYETDEKESTPEVPEEQSPEPQEVANLSSRRDLPPKLKFPDPKLKFPNSIPSHPPLTALRTTPKKNSTISKSRTFRS